MRQFIAKKSKTCKKQKQKPVIVTNSLSLYCSPADSNHQPLGWFMPDLNLLYA